MLVRRFQSWSSKGMHAFSLELFGLNRRNRWSICPGNISKQQNNQKTWRKQWKLTLNTKRTFCLKHDARPCTWGARPCTTNFAGMHDRAVGVHARAVLKIHRIWVKIAGPNCLWFIFQNTHNFHPMVRISWVNYYIHTIYKFYTSFQHQTSKNQGLNLIMKNPKKY